MAEYTIDKFTYGGNTYNLQDSGAQRTLVSGTNIKTVNGVSLLGSGDVPVSGGSGTITGVKTTAGAHTAIDVSSGAVNFNVPTTAAHVGAVADCTIGLYNGQGGNPGACKFCTVNYSSCDSNNGVLVKITMMAGHGNGTSYNHFQDAIISVGYTGTVSVNIFRYYAQSVTYESTTHYYGDIFYTIDTTNKIVTFYDLMGQYSNMYQAPYKKMNGSGKGTVTQFSSTAVHYSSGTKTYANVFWMDGSTKQNTLVSGTNIKTVNSNSLVGSGNVSVGTITGITTSAGTHTTISKTSGSASFNVPTKTSHLTNDSGFTTNTGTITGVTAGTGLSGGGTSGAVTLNHSNSVTAGTIGSSSATSGSTISIPYATYDSNGHITGKGTHTHTVTGFLTAETDPIFAASAAAGITSTNISNWNNKLSGSSVSSNQYMTIGDWRIMWGSVSMNSSSASGSGTFTAPYYNDKSVTFSPAFQAIPFMYATVQGSLTGSRSVLCHDTSTTGSTIRMISSHKNSSDVTIRWLAIGRAL